MKRIISLALLLVMVLTILPLNAFAAVATTTEFWIEDNMLYWEQQDGVKYDIIFTKGGSVKEGGTFKEVDGGHFDLLKAPKPFDFATVLISGQDIFSEIASVKAENDGTYTVTSYDLETHVFKVDQTATTFTFGWSDLGANKYKAVYHDSSIKKTYYIENGETTLTVPYTASNLFRSLSVVALDGLYMGQKIPFRIDATNSARFFVSHNGEKCVVSWSKSDSALEYRLSYKKANSSKYTVLKSQKNSSVSFPFAEDVTFMVYLEAKVDGKWQWIGSRTINGDTLLGDTPDTYANGASKPTTERKKITGLKAEAAGNGVVKLRWDSVKGAENYEVYYRKVGAKKWSGGSGSFLRTKASLSVKFKGSAEYEIKVVSGEKESDVLTVKSNAKKGTVWNIKK